VVSTSTILPEYKIVAGVTIENPSQLFVRGSILRGVFADKNHGYQVVAFATPQSFARVEPELAAMVRSFQPDCAAGSKSP